jgi:transposase
MDGRTTTVPCNPRILKGSPYKSPYGLVISRLIGELRSQIIVRDASAIHSSTPRDQRTEKRDARHILRLLMENWFPAIWEPSVGNEEQRQLVLHRCQLVRMRTRIKNQLFAVVFELSYHCFRVNGEISKTFRSGMEQLRPWVEIV